jgi:threonine dehydrogenase-like Zn-dependent dehydrogenase
MILCRSCNQGTARRFDFQTMVVGMRALLLDENGVRVTSDRAEPVPAPGEHLVRVVRAGVCETDLQLMQGYMGFSGVLGHEFVGRVEMGPASLIGRRVVGEINAVCGDCDASNRSAWGLATGCWWWGTASSVSSWR